MAPIRKPVISLPEESGWIFSAAWMACSASAQRLLYS
jgi:hypothetical protein